MLSSELRVAASRRRAKFWRLSETLVSDAGDGQFDFVHQSRTLADVIGRAAGLYRLHGGFVVVDRSHQNDRGIGRDLVRVAQDFDAIHARHLDVGNNHVEERAVDLALGRFAAGDGFDFMAIAAQGNIEQFADRAFVVADENVTHANLLRSCSRARGCQRSSGGCRCGGSSAGDALPWSCASHFPCAATATRSWCPCRLPNAPTPCPHAPGRSGRRWRGPGRFRLQSSTGTARRFSPSAAG